MSQTAETIDMPQLGHAATQSTDASALQLALLESRQRWRQFGAICHRSRFETDVRGDLTFVAPELV